MKPNVAVAELAVPPPTERSGLRALRVALAPDASLQCEPIWEPRARAEAVPTTDEVLHCHAHGPQLSPQIVAAIIEVLTSPPRAGEGHRDGNDRKEHELRAVLRELRPAEALLVRRRLSASRTDDELVIAFQRFTVDRRARLLAMLADPRRPYS